MNSDILKPIIVLAAFLYFNLIVGKEVDRRNFWIMNIGLALLLFAAILDFADGITAMNNVPILGRSDPFHDILEDQFADTPGLALLIFGAFREILRKKK